MGLNYIKRFALVSSKGGTGKTTTAANLGAMYADLGQRTLLIDTDHQASLSRWYPIVEQAPAGLTQLIQRADATGCISKTAIKNLDIVISDDTKGDRGGKIYPFLMESTSHVLHLNHALDTLDGYDVVIMDTRGASGIMQETVILAANELLSPIPPNFLDAREFLSDTVGALTRLQPAHGMPCLTGRPLANLRGIIYKRNNTTSNARVIQWLIEQVELSDGQISILDTHVPHLSIYNDSVGLAEPAHLFFVLT